MRAALHHARGEGAVMDSVQREDRGRVLRAGEMRRVQVGWRANAVRASQAWRGRESDRVARLQLQWSVRLRALRGLGHPPGRLTSLELRGNPAAAARGQPHRM